MTSTLMILVPIPIILYVLFKMHQMPKPKKKLKKLDLLIQQKQEELNVLSNQIDSTSFKHSNGHSKTQMDALDIYQNSNIKLPTEILEDLHYNDIQDYQEIYAFIENQRQFWKLENMKKPYVKGMKK